MKTAQALSQLYRDALYYHLRRRGYSKTHAEFIVNKSFNKIETGHMI